MPETRDFQAFSQNWQIARESFLALPVGSHTRIIQGETIVLLFDGIVGEASDPYNILDTKNVDSRIYTSGLRVDQIPSDCFYFSSRP